MRQSITQLILTLTTWYRSLLLSLSRATYTTRLAADVVQPFRILTPGFGVGSSRFSLLTGVGITPVRALRRFGLFPFRLWHGKRCRGAQPVEVLRLEGVGNQTEDFQRLAPGIQELGSGFLGGLSEGLSFNFI